MSSNVLAQLSPFAEKVLSFSCDKMSLKPTLAAFVIFSTCLLLGEQSSAASFTEIYAANSGSVVYIDVESSNAPVSKIGTGFIISTDGYVITSAHIVPIGNERMYAVIGQREGVKYPLSFRESDNSLDVALWQLPQSPDCRQPVKLRSAQVRVLDHVMAVGFPASEGLTPTVIAINNLTSSLGFLKTDGHFGGSYSGSPVFDLDGNVVAVVEAGAISGAEDNDLIPISAAIMLANKRGVALLTDGVPVVCGGVRSSGQSTGDLIDSLVSDIDFSDVDKSQRVTTSLAGIALLRNDALITDRVVNALLQKLRYKSSIAYDSDAREVKRQIFTQVLKIRQFNISADLAPSGLKDVDLPGIDASNAKLNGVNLSGSFLIGSTFNNADLSGANLSHTLLRNAWFANTELSGAKLGAADWYNAYGITVRQISRANLDGVDSCPTDSHGKSTISAFIDHVNGVYGIGFQQWSDADKSEARHWWSEYIRLHGVCEFIHNRP